MNATTSPFAPPVWRVFDAAGRPLPITETNYLWASRYWAQFGYTLRPY